MKQHLAALLARHIAVAAIIGISLLAALRAGSTALANPVLCATCEEGCIGSDPIKDTGGCIEWLSLPDSESGDCDPVVHPNPPCRVERTCTLDGVLSFRVADPCSGTWRYRIHQGGGTTPWITLSGTVELLFNALEDSGTVACGQAFEIDFSYQNSSGSYVMSSARYAFSCSVCES